MCGGRLACIWFGAVTWKKESKEMGGGKTPTSSAARVESVQSEEGGENVQGQADTSSRMQRKRRKREKAIGENSG